jgi:hypothetical protein
MAAGASAVSAARPADHAPRAAPHLYWGAWIGTQITGTSAPSDMAAASALETLLGKGMSLLEFSLPFADCRVSPCQYFGFPAAQTEAVRLHGSIPVLSWGSESIPRESTEQPDFQLSDLIEGRYDEYIRQFAIEARKWGHPFFLRFDWEMNGNWFPWSKGVNGNQPGQYVAAWRHVHDIFASVGAKNATWVWCPYAGANGRNGGLRSFYPGNRYVDWTSMDGYNWGRNAVNPQPWRSFGQVFDATYQQLSTRIAPHKPIMLGEFASSNKGGDKAGWIRQMFEELPRHYPRIRGMIWFDTIDRGVKWPLESSPSASRAFAAGIAEKTYASNHFTDLPVGPVKPLR